MSDQPKVIGQYKIINFPSTATLLAIGVISLAVLVVMMLFYREIPEKNQQPFSIIAGVVLTWGSAVIGFYFGDSKKSAQQQDTITSLATAPQVAADKQEKAAEKQDKAADKQLAAADDTQKKD